MCITLVPSSPNSQSVFVVALRDRLERFPSDFPPTVDIVQQQLTLACVRRRSDRCRLKRDAGCQVSKRSVSRPARRPDLYSPLFAPPPLSPFFSVLSHATIKRQSDDGTKETTVLHIGWYLRPFISKFITQPLAEMQRRPPCTFHARFETALSLSRNESLRSFGSIFILLPPPPPASRFLFFRNSL